MINPIYPLTASSSQHMLVERISLRERQIADALSTYEPRSTSLAWFDTLRAIEECINLIHVDWNDEEFENLLFTLPLRPRFESRPEFQVVEQRLIAQFSINFANRLKNLITFGLACARAAAAHGHIEVILGFSTVGAMIGYFQSRRRHFIALMQMLPKACCGHQIVRPYEALLVFLPVIESAGIPLRTEQNALNVKLARAKLALPERDCAELATLDSFFLEPERAPIIDMSISNEAATKLVEAKEALRPDRLFSAAELRNDILHIEFTYAEFNLKETAFAPAAALVRQLSIDFVEKDFWVAIRPEDLYTLFDEFKVDKALQSELIPSADTYLKCLSTYTPFVLVGGVYRSTVTLLSRFIYYWRARSLDSQKRFQIRTGFIFEKAVAAELELHNFVIRKDIRRINRKEFDVIAVRDGIIWNIQCKNNFVDLDTIDYDAARFAAYNYKLVRSYEKALLKEQHREHLLKEKLSLEDVQHIIISRVPVVADNPRFVPYSRITDFGNIADMVLALDTENHETTSLECPF